MNPLIIIEVIIGFGFMIFIHEGGHYLACRLFSIAVDEFALGFGPILVSRKWGNTIYSIRAIPLGGFCKPKGGDLSAQSPEEMYAKPAEPGDFLYASWWKRIIVFLAGPSMNFISAFIIVALIFIVLGKPVSNSKPVLGYVPPGSLADNAGLQRGDLILKINEKEVTSFKTIGENILDYGKTVKILVRRESKVFETEIKCPPKPADENSPEINWGIAPSTPAVVGEAILGQPARNSGIREGDEIVSINGRKPIDWNEVVEIIRNVEKDPLEFEIRRGQMIHKVSLQRVFNGKNKVIGIGPKVKENETRYEKIPLPEAITISFTATIDQSKEMLKIIGKLITGKVSFIRNVGGPITIVRMMYQKATQSFADLLYLVSVISLMLFIMNLLPIPIVDGGQILLCVCEGILRKPVSIKAQMIYQQVGLFLVIALMGLAVFNDIKNIFLEFLNRFH